MAWPNLIARIYTVLSSAWSTARAQVSAEIDQLIDMCNALLDEGQAQELRITANADAIADIESYAAGLHRGLVVRQSRVSPATDILITADMLALDDDETVITAVSVTCDLGDAGAGGLDAGTVAADTFYYIFVIHDSTGVASPDTDALASTSATPTLPTTFDRYRMVCQLLTDSTGDLHAFNFDAQTGTVLVISNENDVDAGKVARVALSGVSDSAWSVVDLTAMQPPATDNILVRFVGVGSAGVDETYILYGKPTWGIDAASDGLSYQRRLHQLATDSATEAESAISEIHLIELDDSGQYSFYQSADNWGSLYVYLVGWRMQI